MPKRVDSGFDLPGNPTSTDEARALVLWMTGNYTYSDIAEIMQLPKKTVLPWSYKWPSKHQLAQRTVADLSSQARALRDDNLMETLKAEISALKLDREMLDNLREKLKAGATLEDVEAIVRTAEVISRRADRLFDLKGSTSEGQPAKPLVNINLLTQGAGTVEIKE